MLDFELQRVTWREVLSRDCRQVRKVSPMFFFHNNALIIIEGDRHIMMSGRNFHTQEAVNRRLYKRLCGICRAYCPICKQFIQKEPLN